MVFRSNPATVIYACSVPEMSTNGKPEAKSRHSKMRERRWVSVANRTDVMGIDGFRVNLPGAESRRVNVED